MNSRSVCMIFHHNLWPLVPQSELFFSKSGKTNSDTSTEACVAKDSVGKSYTHTPAVHEKSHTYIKVEKIDNYNNVSKKNFLHKWSNPSEQNCYAHFALRYRIVASTNTCYYSENQIFCFLKSRIVT